MSEVAADKRRFGRGITGAARSVRQRISAHRPVRCAFRYLALVASMHKPTALFCLVLLLGSRGCARVADGPLCDNAPNVAPPTSLEGQPSWLPIGAEVYDEADVAAVEQTRLSVRMEPRWFRGFGRAVTRAEFEANLAKLHAAGYRFDAQTEPLDRYVLPDPPPYPRRLADVP